MADTTNLTTGTAGGTNTGAAPATGTNNQPGQSGQPEPSKTYTQEELNRIVQSETDKRVQQALATQEAKLRKQITKEVQDRQDEAARFAKMNADEKAKAINDKRVAKLDARERALERDRLVFEAEKELAARSLPVEFAEDLCGTDAENTKARIDAFEKRFNEAIQAGITQKMRGRTPSGGGFSNEPSGTPDFSKMTYSESLQYLKDHPEVKFEK